MDTSGNVFGGFKPLQWTRDGENGKLSERSDPPGELSFHTEKSARFAAEEIWVEPQMKQPANLRHSL
jgi:hypothetical protein